MSPAMTFMNLTAGKWVSQAIAVAAELGIADLLKEGTKTAAQIAQSANASEDGLYRLLRALASVGLFAETRNRAFRLTPLGRLLCTDSPQALGAYARFVGHDSTWRRGESLATASLPVSQLLIASSPCRSSSTSGRCQKLPPCSTRQ